ncbi:MAG TPA: STAS domain-containing protein [Gemmataceae bacterium]|jgi:anti-anti-sigma factor|nr:STAS domain-containing protein [Gemmataceae bacterium]
MTEAPRTNLTSRVDQGVLVVTFTTKQIQDEKLSEAILQELTALIDQHRARKLVIDFQNIKYISSVAFRPLLNIRRKLNELSGRLVLCGLSQVVGDVFYTTKLVSPDGSFAAPFELASDAADAVARLNQSEMPA